jgi:hypothetical protein
MLDRTALAFVVDQEFGWELRSLAESMPVQIVDSPANRPAIESVWQERRTGGLDREVTVFRAVPGIAPEEHLIGLLRTLTRAGSASEREPSPTTIHVLGLPLTPAIDRRIAALSVGACRPTAGGFRIHLSDPSAGADKAGS